MACIYKIVCKDKTINDSYVGKTKNKNTRWVSHKHYSKPQSRLSHIKLYDFINNHGGINNWQMVVLEEFEWNKDLARQKERYYYEITNHELNSDYPGLTSAESCKRSELKYIEARKKHRHEHKVEKIICECGMSVSRGSMSEHRKRGRHAKRMEQLQ